MWSWSRHCCSITFFALVCDLQFRWTFECAFVCFFPWAFISVLRFCPIFFYTLELWIRCLAVFLFLSLTDVTRYMGHLTVLSSPASSFLFSLFSSLSSFPFLITFDFYTPSFDKWRLIQKAILFVLCSRKYNGKILALWRFVGCCLLLS